MSEQNEASSMRFGFEVPERIRKPAIEWVLKLQSAGDPEPLRQPFERWLALDPIHLHAFRAMRVVWAFRQCAMSRLDMAGLKAIIERKQPVFGAY
jgi:ferric-dicitrate binding protein FerR (iron transport regulator)